MDDTPPASHPQHPDPAARAIAHVAALSSGAPLDRSLALTMNFHPDRLVRGQPLLQALLQEGVYRSQFETGTSNGGLSAFEGGARWLWESRIFGGAYDGAAPGHRPKYGALNYRRRAAGGSPRFGSAHLRLRPDVVARCTFCYPDSVFEPEHFGVAARIDLVARARWPATRTRSTTTSRRTSTEHCGSTPTSRRWCSTPAIAAARWKRGRGAIRARSSGTPDSGSTSPHCGAIPATAVGTSSNWARPSHRTACSIRPVSAGRRQKGGTMRRS